MDKPKCGARSVADSGLIEPKWTCSSRTHPGYVHADNLDQIIRSINGDDVIYDSDGDEVFYVRLGDLGKGIKYGYGDPGSPSEITVTPSYILIPEDVSNEAVQAAIASIQATSTPKQPVIDDWTRWCWQLYLDACVCSMDYGSNCDCPAADMASARLEEVLGPNWHDIMRTKED